jgi:hypothetical protein
MQLTVQLPGAVYAVKNENSESKHQEGQLESLNFVLLVLVIKEFIFSKIQDCQFNHQRALYA